MLRIFTPVKIQRLRPGLNPRTWVPEASMLTARPPKPSDISLSYVPILASVCYDLHSERSLSLLIPRLTFMN